MLKKNDIVTVCITDMSDTGDGIGKADGFPLFVRHGVIGDTAEVIVTRVKKSYGYARIQNLIEPSECRTEPPCPCWKRCGGCQLQNLTYNAQLAFKTNKVRQALSRIGGLKKIVVEDCVGSPEILRYRNKVQYPVGYDKNGNLIAGFYAARSHEIIPSEDCLLSPPEFPQILKTVMDWMRESSISAYDETTGKGIVRHVYLRKGYATGETGICLIINKKALPHAEELKEKLSSFRQITGLTISVNRKQNNVILGESVEVLYGSRFIHDRIGPVTYQIDPLSFYQVNPLQTRRLYDCVKEFADLKGEENVWDLYCGIGSISLYLADKAKNIIGIEVIERAIEDAKINAGINGISNAEFFAGDVAEIFPKMYSDRSTSDDVIILDPPRKGCDPIVLNAIVKAQPSKVIYVSCNPATLARDLKVFCEGGYEIRQVRPYDMFPMSGHVEVVSLLQKMSNTRERTITLDVEMEDYHRIKNRTEVTADATE